MKIKIYARTDRVGSQVERIIDVDDDYWNEMDNRAREDYMLEEFWNLQLVEWGYDPLGSGGSGA